MLGDYLLYFLTCMPYIHIHAIFFLCFPDDCFVSLTQKTVQFAKSSLQLVDDLLRLYTIELETLIAAAIETLFNAQMSQFQAALKAEKFQSDVSDMYCNPWFCCCQKFYFSSSVVIILNPCKQICKYFTCSLCCVCVCVCARARACVCVCVCVLKYTFLLHKGICKD